MERLAETIILPAGPGDAAALGELHVRCWRETYASLLPAHYLARMSGPLHARRFRHQLTRPRAGEVVLAAEGPEGLIGYSAGLRTLDAADGPHGEIFTLYLLRAAQRRGLGRRLLASGARVLAAEGARSLRLWVLSANESAREFYQRLGGAQGAERPVGGWGGGLMETVYTWSDIGVLARADA